jgi:hypothetical protein
MLSIHESMFHVARTNYKLSSTLQSVFFYSILTGVWNLYYPKLQEFYCVLRHVILFMTLLFLYFFIFCFYFEG